MSLISPALMQRFDIPGPRYTSYPTADRFQSDGEARAFTQALALRSAGEALPLSLYVHLPFCESVC